jgi:hypothetical protein
VEKQFKFVVTFNISETCDYICFALWKAWPQKSTCNGVTVYMVTSDFVAYQEEAEGNMCERRKFGKSVCVFHHVMLHAVAATGILPKKEK